MGSSDKLFNRQRSLHQILGGGFVADVVLWRRKDVTMGILLVALFAWVVFERSGYTLLSLVSSVFFLLFTILFLWAKSAAILNRYLTSKERKQVVDMKQTKMVLHCLKFKKTFILPWGVGRGDEVLSEAEMRAISKC